jgi:hypothetical protein
MIAAAIILFIFNSQDIIFLITSFIDIFAIIVIGVSVSFSILALLKITITFNPFTSNSFEKRSEQERSHYLMTNRRRRIKIAKENFIKGLLLALDLESANAILKLGVFSSSILTGTATMSTATTTSTFNMNNFLFFIGVLSIRIGINQTLRRFNV